MTHVHCWRDNILTANKLGKFTLWNAGIRLESSCILPVNTVPNGGQVESLCDRNYWKVGLELRADRTFYSCSIQTGEQTLFCICLIHVHGIQCVYRQIVLQTPLCVYHSRWMHWVNRKYRTCGCSLQYRLDADDCWMMVLQNWDWTVIAEVPTWDSARLVHSVTWLEGAVSSTICTSSILYTETTLASTYEQSSLNS